VDFQNPGEESHVFQSMTDTFSIGWHLWKLLSR
jgi:hypothetical protein